MKEILAMFAVVVLFIILGYVIWAASIPMRVAEKAVDRKITQQSQQYVETQRTALVNLYAAYTGTEDEVHRVAIKSQMCDLANKIPSGEIPTSVMGVVRGCI